MVWRRMDLHIHTPASADYQEPDISYLDILRKADARGADLIAFTDHNSVRGFANLWREIEDLELLEALDRLAPAEQRRLEEYRRLMQKMRVLPGFEFTATFGFHILAIFPEGTSIRVIEHVLLELNIPEDKVDLGSSEVGATTDVLNAYEILHEAGALVIPAHVNSTHGVAMQHLPFGGQTKIAFTQSPYIDALEATDLESTSRRATSRFFNGSKPEYPRRMHIVQGSDAHRLNRDPNRESNLGVGDRMTEALLPEVSWAALADLFHSEQFNRIRPYRPSHDPYDFVRMSRSEGETIVQAFHDQIPPRRGRQSPIVRDAAAFANGNGGTIFVGLSAHPTEIILGVPDAPGEARAIAEDLARFVTPPVAGTIEIHTTDNKQIIVISIPPGADKPYAVLPSTIFVRQEGETTIALRDEIVQLVRAASDTNGERVPAIVPAATTRTVTPSASGVGPYFAVPTAAVVAAISDPSLADDNDDDGDAADEFQPAMRSSRRRRGGRGRGRGPGQELATDPDDTADTVVSESSIAGVESFAASTALPEPPDQIEVADETIAEMDASSPTSTVQSQEREDIPYPRTGVEIVESVERDGVIYHAMRDLRNLKVVHNVTRDSARRLWRYAITQRETQVLNPDDVTWFEDGRGFWKAYKQRGGEQRFNLAYRHDEHLHIFFGVTDEGLDDEWRALIPADKLPPPATESGTDDVVYEDVATSAEDFIVAPRTEPAVSPPPEPPAPAPARMPAQAEPTVVPVPIRTALSPPTPSASLGWAEKVAAALAAATGGVATPTTASTVEPEPEPEPEPVPESLIESAPVEETQPEAAAVTTSAPRRRPPRRKPESSVEVPPELPTELSFDPQSQPQPQPQMESFEEPEPIESVVEAPPVALGWAEAVAAALAAATAGASPSIEAVTPGIVAVPEPEPDTEPAPKPASRRRPPRRKPEVVVEPQPTETTLPDVDVTADVVPAPPASAEAEPAPKRRRPPRRKPEPVEQTEPAEQVIDSGSEPTCVVEPEAESTPAPKRRRAPRRKIEPTTVEAPVEGATEP